MKKMVKVSIITVCFNSGKTISRTIEHVLRQTYPNIEYLIIDGGSKDNTVEIIKRYECLFEGRLKWVSEPDNGIYDAMNKGIKMASGELIGISNSDDWLENDAVEKIIPYYKPEKKQIIYGAMSLRKDDEKWHKTVFINHECLYEENLPHPACFVSRSTYDAVGLYGEKYRLIADYEFMLKAFESKSVEFVPVNCLVANFTEGGASSNIKCNIELANLLYEYGCISKKILIKRLVVLNLKKIFQRFKLLG